MKLTLLFLLITFPLFSQNNYNYGSYNYGSYNYGDKSLGLKSLIVPGGAKAACYAKFGIIGTDTCWLDISGHGRHAKIVGCDFWNDPEKELGILPYRTKAVIVFPSSLLTYDLDSFMFDGNLAARQIPPISMFQNIDYGNKLYCKEIAQVLNSDSTEVHGAGVRYFTVYESVQTGVNLTAANSWFGVPVKDASGKWVAKNGNDGTGNGSEATPWLTIDKAVKTVSAGTKIYVKTGVYIENTSSLNVLVLHNSAKIIGTGLTEIRAAGTDNSAVVYFHSGSTGTEFSGFIINGQNNINYPITVNGAATIAKINRCRIINTKTWVVYLASGLITSFDNNVITGTFTYVMDPSHVFPITNTYINATLRAVSNNSGSGNILFKYNKGIISAAAGYTPYLINNASGSTSLTVKYNKFTCTGNYTDGIITTASANTIADVQYNEITSTNLASDIKVIFWFKNAATITCQFNKSISLVETANYHIAVSSTGTTTTLCDLKYNNISTRSLTGYAIVIGSEGTTANNHKITNISIIGNKILGALYYDSSKTSTEHGIFVGFNNNPIIKYNYVNGSGINIIVKGSGYSFTTGCIAYNICLNPGLYNFYSKAIPDVPFYNNVSYNNVDRSVKHFFFSDNTGSDGANNCIVKNNIIIDKSVNANSYLMLISNTTGIISNYNLLYSNSGAYAQDGVTVYNTFATWQAHSQDANSISQNINFNSSLNFWPVPKIEIGENLGTTYNTGIDITNIFGATTVTKNQVVPWQIGAYIQ